MAVYRLNAADFPSGNVKQFDAGNVLEDYYPSVAHGVQVSWDADQQAARMVMPSQSGSAACGTWTRQSVFNRAQSTVGFAMRFKWDEAACYGGGYPQAAGNQSFPKLVILHEGSASCQAQEFTSTNYYWTRWFAWYTACGGAGVQEVLGGGNYEFQPGGDTSCWYNGTNPANLLRAVVEPDVWYTYVTEFTRMDQPGSERAEVWLYPEGGTLSPNAWIKILDYDFAAYSHGAAAIKWINSYVVGMYSTSKNATVEHTPWNAWYQDILLNPGPVRGVYGIEAAPVTATGESYTITTGTTKIAVGRYTLPAWREAMGPKTWASPSAAVMNDLNPTANASRNPQAPGTLAWGGATGFGAGVLAYGGFYFDYVLERLGVGPQGGHGDYAGNEVMAQDLRADGAPWEYVHPSSGDLTYLAGPLGTSADYNDSNAAAGVYAFDTSRPRSSHAYQRFVACPERRCLIIPRLMGSYPDASNGPQADQAWRIDLDDGTCTLTQGNGVYGGGGTLSGSTSYTDSASVWCPDDDLVVHLPTGVGAKILTYDVLTDTRALPGGVSQSGSNGVSLATFGRYVFQYVPAADTLWTWDIDNLAANPVQATLSGGWPSGHAAGFSMVAIASRDGSRGQLVWWNVTNSSFATQVVVADIPASPEGGTYTRRAVTAAAGNAVTPGVLTGQTFGRLHWSPRTRTLYTVNLHTSPTYAYAVPDQGLD